MTLLIPAVLFVVALSYTTVTIFRGPVLSPDSLTYSRWADLLIAVRFDYVSWARSIDFAVPPLAYAGWVTVVAANKVILGPDWASGVVLINLGLALSAAAMVLLRVRGMTSSWPMVCVAGAAFLGAFEFFLWIPYALSDVSFGFICCFALYAVSGETWSTQRAVWRRAPPFALALFALFYRPSGLPLTLAVVFAAVVIPRLRRGSSGDLTVSARKIASGFALLFAVIVLMDSVLMSDASRWPLPLLSSWIRELSDEYGQGMVVFGRPETFHAPPQGLLDYLWLNVDRLRWFFTFWSADFSAGHELANFVFFVPVYVGWLVAVASVLTGRINSSWTLWSTTVIGTVFIAFVCLFHSLQQLDFDWRYRLPCLPVLIMLGAVGWHQILQQLEAMTRDVLVSWRRRTQRR